MMENKITTDSIANDGVVTAKLLASVIIPHYQLHSMLMNFCLPNLYMYGKGIETIIVDNGSKEPLAIDGPQKVVRTKKRMSFAEACNFGATEAQSDILIFMNNDLQVLPGWLEPLLEAFNDKKTMICGSKILSVDGRIQHVGVVFGKKRVPYHKDLGHEDNPKENKTKEVPAVTGALMAVRKDWFDKAGGFCEQYPDGNYEDIDLCLLVKKEGFKVKIALGSKSVHLGGASYKLHPEEHTELLVRRNWEVLNDRWKDEPNKFFGITAKTELLPREQSWGLK